MSLISIPTSLSWTSPARLFFPSLNPMHTSSFGINYSLACDFGIVLFMHSVSTHMLIFLHL
jgi:hypothetical protein